MIWPTFGRNHTPDNTRGGPGITDASATNPYLVKVMPGAYEPTRSKPYVTIEGSGASQTFIGNVTAVNNAAVRDVTLGNTVILQANATLERVVVRSSYAYVVGVSEPGVRIIDTTIEGIDCGLYSTGTGIWTLAPFDLTDSQVRGCDYAVGFNAHYERTTIDQSRLQGGTAALFLENSALPSSVAIRGSVVSAPNILASSNGGGLSVLVGTSQIGASTASLRPGIDRLVRSYTSSFEPISDF